MTSEIWPTSLGEPSTLKTRMLHERVQVFIPFEQTNCKGISLELCLVTWIGFYLRAVVPLIIFSLSPVFPSVTYCVNPLNLLLDNV